MKRIFQGAVSVLMLAVLNILSLGIHTAAAAPMNMEHSMGASHTASSSNCFNICTTATPHRDETLDDTSDDEDDESQPPFYVQFQTSSIVALEEQHNQETRSAIDREPPPDSTPAYIKLTVFRA